MAQVYRQGESPSSFEKNHVDHRVDGGYGARVIGNLNLLLTNALLLGGAAVGF